MASAEVPGLTFVEAKGLGSGPNGAEEAEAEGRGDRPRRVAPETLEYLAGIEDELDRLQRAARNLPGPAGAEDAPGPGDLVANVLEEIAYTAASVAEDRRGSFVLEKIVAFCDAEQLAALLRQLEAYGKHLALNRYSSHVLENIFLRAHALRLEAETDDGAGRQAPRTGLGDEEAAASAEDADNVGDAEAGVARAAARAELDAALLGLHDSFRPHYLDLMHDWCASHVVRASLCCLVGADPAVPKRRGKNAKHKHGGSRGGLPREAERDGSAGPMRPAVSAGPSLLAGFETILGNLAGMDVRDAQAMAMDRHACTVLCVLVRLAAGLERRRDRSGFGAAEAMIRHLLEWPAEAATSPEASSGAPGGIQGMEGPMHALVVLGMSGEVEGSHFVQCVLECAGPPEYRSLFEECFRGRLASYTQHEISNYVVQSLLRVGVTVGTPDLASEMLGELVPLMSECLARYSGVVCEACRLAAAHGVQQEPLLRALQGSASDYELLQRMLRLRPESPGTGKARGLQFRSVPQVQALGAILGGFAEDVVRDLLRILLTEDACEDVMRDLAFTAVSARAVVEPVMDRRINGTFVQDRLLAIFEPVFLDLALHPCGHHVLVKFSRTMGLAQQEQIVAPLAEAKHRLAGSRIGQNSMKALGVDGFLENLEAWRARMRQERRKQELLAEVSTDLVDAAAAKVKRRKPSQAGEMDALFAQGPTAKRARKAKKAKRERAAPAAEEPGA